MRDSIVVLACVFASFACARSPNVDAPAQTSDAGAVTAQTPPEPFVIEAFTFTANPKFTSHKRVELRADGVILADGKEIGHIAGPDVFVEGAGKTGTLHADGTFKSTLTSDPARFEGDVWVNPGRGRMEIAADGTVNAVDGEQSLLVGKLDKIVKAKRAALVAIMLGTAKPPEMDNSAVLDPHLGDSADESSSSQPAPSAKPTKKPGAKPATKPKKK